MKHDHHHKFDPANVARIDDPRRREALPPAKLAEALPLLEGQRVADVGALLIRKVFRPGMREPWPAFVEHATGHPLSAEAFAREVTR